MWFGTAIIAYFMINIAITSLYIYDVYFAPYRERDIIIQLYKKEANFFTVMSNALFTLLFALPVSLYLIVEILLD